MWNCNIKDFMIGIVKGYDCKIDILIFEIKILEGVVIKIFLEMILVYEVFDLFFNWLIFRNLLSVVIKI